MCKFEDPFDCEFHEECRKTGECIDDQLWYEAEHQRQIVEASRQSLTQQPTLVGVLMVNTAPADLILLRLKNLLEEIGAATKIVKGDNGDIYVQLGPFDCADDYVVTALCGGDL